MTVVSCWRASIRSTPTPELMPRVAHRSGVGWPCLRVSRSTTTSPDGPVAMPMVCGMCPPPAVDLVGVGAGPSLPPIDHRGFLGAGGDGEDVPAASGEVQGPGTQVGGGGVHSG